MKYIKLFEDHEYDFRTQYSTEPSEGWNWFGVDIAGNDGEYDFAEYWLVYTNDDNKIDPLVYRIIEVEQFERYIVDAGQVEAKYFPKRPMNLVLRGAIADEEIAFVLGQGH